MAQSKWNIDLSHSGVNFSIRHMVISKVRGRFTKFTGVLTFDDEDITRSVVEATIDASSIDTGVEQRDAHLRSADFFDVEKYPELRFRSTRIEKLDDNRFRVVGQLTIRDVTRDVVLPFTLEIGEDRADPSQLLARASGEVTISRLGYGIGRDEWKDTTIVADAVTIRVDVVARRKK